MASVQFHRRSPSMCVVMTISILHSPWLLPWLLPHCASQARWRSLAAAPWPRGCAPCSTALGATSWQTSCWEAAPSTISNTTATSCWPQLYGERRDGMRREHYVYRRRSMHLFIKVVTLSKVYKGSHQFYFNSCQIICQRYHYAVVQCTVL